MIDRRNSFRELGSFGALCIVVSWLAGTAFIAGAVVAITNWHAAPNLDLRHFDAQIPEQLAYVDSMGRVSLSVSIMIIAAVVCLFSRVGVLLVRIANKPPIVGIQHELGSPART